LVDRESRSCKHVSILMGFHLKLNRHWLSSCAGVVHLVDSELFFMLWVPSEKQVSSVVVNWLFTRPAFNDQGLENSLVSIEHPTWFQKLGCL
jgi:hypothetical protein